MKKSGHRKDAKSAKGEAMTQTNEEIKRIAERVNEEGRAPQRCEERQGQARAKTNEEIEQIAEQVNEEVRAPRRCQER
jgi:hypothetical protein